MYAINDDYGNYGLCEANSQASKAKRAENPRRSIFIIYYVLLAAPLLSLPAALPTTRVQHTAHHVPH